MKTNYEKLMKINYEKLLIFYLPFTVTVFPAPLTSLRATVPCALPAFLNLMMSKNTTNV